MKKHKSAVDEFSSRIVRQGLVPRKAETVLRRLYRLREISDYDLARKLSPRDAAKAVEDAADFCATVAEWCRGQLGKLL